MRWNKKAAFSIAVVICLVSVFMGGSAGTAEAATPVKVFVNGQQALFPDVQPMIIDGRTMVPLRFVAETPSFGAVVSYDDASRQVTLLRGPKTVILWPSSRTVVVDGESSETDVAPVVKQGRTMVPLRFISESFGATVDWNEATRAVSIEIAPPSRMVLGYYYGGSYDEFRSRYSCLTDVAFHWYEADEKGNLVVKTPDSYRLAVDFADQNGVRKEASISMPVSWSDPQKLHALLSSTANRSRFTDNLVRLAQQEGYRCINLDLEGVKPEDKDGYLALLAQLSQNLRQAGIGFVVAAPAKDSEKSWYAAYDYGVIAGYADRVVLMAYDCHSSTSEPGAVAPFSWVVDVVDYALQFFTPQQIIMGIGVYGYNWPEDWSEDKKATSLDAPRAEALAAAHNVQPVWDNDASAPHFSYTDDDGIRREVWYENRPSLKMKLDFAKSRGLAGISIWRLGLGFPEFWQDVAAYMAS